MQQTGSANENGAAGRVEVFEYPAGPACACFAGLGALEHGEASCEDPTRTTEHSENCGPSAGGAGSAASSMRGWPKRSARAFEAGRERGRQEGRQAEREAQAAAQAAAEERRVQQAAELVESLAQERDRYLHAVEHEVVKLALAVAARILRREAQMDPLLLTGAVRVALGQLSARPRCGCACPRPNSICGPRPSPCCPTWR